MENMMLNSNTEYYPESIIISIQDKIWIFWIGAKMWNKRKGYVLKAASMKIILGFCGWEQISIEGL